MYRSPELSSSQGRVEPGEVLSEGAFHRMISLERRRSERSQRPFVLLLIDTGRNHPGDKQGRVLLDMLSALQGATRETDVTGWYTANSVVGVMFTEIVLDNNAVLSTILSRIGAVLRGQLDTDQFSRIKFSFHVFPDDWNSQDQDMERPSNPTLYPDLEKRQRSNRLGRATKRMIDVVGSLTLLAMLSPILFIIAVVIKLTSRGPILFRQKRIGEHGTPFTFLKFRSMYINNDSSEHKEYVRQLIAGQAEKKPANGNGTGVFKLTNDRRITPVGRILRRASLDELPQLINVLHGEMSLVGPRPPVPYEVEAYATWHRRRLLEAKPGITGLWQVYGRSRVEFDDMVRLDLRYARDCSPLLDLKILLQTPRAVMGGDGAC
ncbi:MAG: sugar transferase [Terriglobales bacterium]|jgi:lipopolysaccharide/colanic/teichoic acid biosynthesis glycosyltransferase